jgi:hypothetical protein
MDRLEALCVALSDTALAYLARVDTPSLVLSSTYISCLFARLRITRLNSHCTLPSRLSRSRSLPAEQ